MNSSDQNNPNENNPFQNNLARKGKGRQKIEMVKIENPNNLQVTFSKRRAGLFKKASELCTLIGCEIAIVIFSPSEKVHSFGHPNLETIIARFVNENQNLPQPGGNNHPLPTRRYANIIQTNQELIQSEHWLENARFHSQQLENLRKDRRNQAWCPPDFDQLRYQQLVYWNQAIESFKQAFDMAVENYTNMMNQIVQETNPEHRISGPGQTDLYDSGGSSMFNKYSQFIPDGSSNFFGVPFSSDIPGLGHVPDYGNDESYVFNNNAQFIPGGSSNYFGVPFNSDNPGSSHVAFYDGDGSSYNPQFVQGGPSGPSGTQSGDPIFDSSHFINQYHSMANHHFNSQDPMCDSSGQFTGQYVDPSNPESMVQYNVGTSGSRGEHPNHGSTQGNGESRNQG